MLPELTSIEKSRYARNIKIPEIGEKGQRKLKDASVLIIGVGGLGSASALYLAAAGLGRIGLLDYDRVEITNLNRQIIHDTPMLGKFKVDSAKQRLESLNPHIQVEIFPQLLEKESADEVVSQYSIVVDGTDNFAARYLINEVCVRLARKYVYGAIYQFSGQVSVFDASKGPCFQCVFKKLPPPEFITAYQGIGVIGALPGTIATIQAVEVIKLVLGIGNTLIGRLLLYDALEMKFGEVAIQKDPQCPVCKVPAQKIFP